MENFTITFATIKATEQCVCVYPMLYVYERENTKLKMMQAGLLRLTVYCDVFTAYLAYTCIPYDPLCVCLTVF